MHLQKMTLREIPALSRVFAQSWKVCYAGMVPQDYLDTLTDDRWIEPFEERLQSGRYEGLLLCDGETVIGGAMFGASHDEKCPAPVWAELQSLYLLPEYWGRGCGHLLFAAALETLHAQGFSRVYLWALRENLHAQDFYRRHGFVDNGDLLTVELAGKELVDHRFIYKLSEFPSFSTNLTE